MKEHSHFSSTAFPQKTVWDASITKIWKQSYLTFFRCKFVICAIVAGAINFSPKTQTIRTLSLSKANWPLAAFKTLKILTIYFIQFMKLCL